MKLISAIALTSAFIAPAAFAQHADLLLIRDDAGNLLTGLYDFGDGDVVSTNTRVHEGEFDQFGSSDEPGFNAIGASNVPAGFQALQGNVSVAFDANAFEIGSTTANLFHWDGTGEVNFTAAANTLTVSKAPSNIFSATLDASSNSITGFEIDTTSSDGFLHKHIDFTLSDISSSANGFYLWSFTLSAGSDIADPIFFVHGFGLEDEVAHEAAIDWVGANLVPAPGTLAMLLAAPAMMTRRRR